MPFDGVLFKTTDNDKWGAGKGSPLTASEVDENMFELLSRIQALEADDGSDAVGISNITVSGTQMFIHLSNGNVEGPFTLPSASFRDRGEWANNTAYLANDIFIVPQVGFFRVLKDHTSAATGPFDPLAQSGGDFLYFKIFGEDTYRYEIGFFFPGYPGNGIASNGAMAAHLVLEDMYLPANLANSTAKLITAPADELVFTLKQDTTTIGLITFAAGQTLATFDFPAAIQFLGADKKALRLIRPSDIDLDAQELIITINGIRGTL